MRAFLRRTIFAGILAPLAFSGLLGAPAFAQRDLFPPAGVPGGRDVYPAQSAGNGSLLVRIDKLEDRIRNLTGQIEQLQFQMRRMQQQLESFQKDVDFRFKESGGGSPSGRQRRGDIAPDPVKPKETVQPDQPDTPRRTARRGGDAFDPADNPNAPGAPVQLGSPRNQPSAPLPRGPISRDMPIEGDPDGKLPDPDGPVNLSRAAPGPAADPSRTPGSNPAPPNAAADATPREAYNIALAALKSQRYDDAEAGFKTFVSRFPKSTLAASAIFNLGIAYAGKGRHREAAEQFLKVSTDHRKSSRAPESLYRLGLSLEKLGAREQACASYAEVERRYPRAPSRLRAQVDRQIARAKC
ncbi:MAG: tol-pal system protein YbgF [Beijerinckiaceae bacterium]